MASDAKKLILVVDDDVHVRSGLEAGLAYQEHQVATAANGCEALAWLETHRPDLIVLDLAMPELDGVGLIGELRRRARHVDVPILVLSGEPGARDRMAGLGVTAFLSKPISLVPLLTTVTHLLPG